MTSGNKDTKNARRDGGCASPGCDRAAHTMGFCTMHYQRMRRAERKKNGTNGHATARKAHKNGEANKEFFAACLLDDRDADDVLDEMKRDYTRKILSKTAVKYL